MRLQHAVAVEMMLENLLFDHVLTELKQVDAVNEVLFREIVAFAFTDTFHGLCPQLLVLHDLFQAEKFILA